MTVGEMRELMRRRVVPEGLVPQNVIGLLIDDEEDATPPELDAFTFLTRLRALGIGSADFLYLLEGCEAPQSAVDRVKANPAMNLQSLILTLESSGLTSDDYSRMLYTARQIWERTLTLRLEKSEMVSRGGEEIEDYSEPSVEEVMDGLEQLNESDEPHDSVSSYEEFKEEFVTEELAPPMAIEAEDMSSAEAPVKETAVTEVVETRSEEAPETVLAAEAPVADEYVEKTEENEPEQPIYEPVEENAPAETSETEALLEMAAVNEEPAAVEAAEAFVREGADKNEPERPVDKPVEENVPAETNETEESPEAAAVNEDPVAVETVEVPVEENSAEYPEDAYEPSEETAEPAKPYNGETTMIIQIDQEMLRQNLELLAKAEEDAVRAEAARVAAEQAQREARAAYAAAKAEETEISGITEDGEPSEESDNEPDNESDIPIKTGKQAPFVVSIPSESHYHKGAIITAAVGAAVLVGASAVADVFAGDLAARSITYAKTSSDIFDEIHKAYYNKTPGGDKAAAYVPDHRTLFGDLLVNSSGFGTLSDGENVYSVTEEAISAKTFKNGVLTVSGDLLPPKDTSFAAVFDDRGTLVAVFGGRRECGYMRISGGSVLYTVRQDGFLTDFALEDDGVTLGSVYTPSFSRNFTAEDIDVFMPSVGVEKTPMPVENVVLSGTEGYSYAVSARYSLTNGETESVYAALGDPVSASSDGRFAMRGTEEYLLIKTGETILTAKAESDSQIAFSEKGCAVGKDNTVNLLSEDFVLMSQIANLPPSSLPQGNMPEAMRFKGDTLLIYGDTGLCRAADCSDIENPRIIALKEVNGAADSENALVLSAGGEGAEFSYYILENGGANEKYKFTKPLSAEELSTLRFGGIDTIVLDGERCGAAFSYFDGVSVISDYAVMSSGKLETSVKELFDDKTGFTLAFKGGGKIYAVCGNGITDVLK